jgi:hypothetical protein
MIQILFTRMVTLAVLCAVAYNYSSAGSGDWDKIVEGTVHKAGFMDFYWKPQEGKLYLEVGFPSEQFLYVSFLTSGLGSNDIGLDRGQLGDTRVVQFRRFGDRLLLIQPNLAYRADSDNLDELLAVEEAFAQSVLWGFPVEAEKNNRVLIDITEFVLSDAHGVADRLYEAEQGQYVLDKGRSAIFEETLKNFEKNSVFEGLVTFSGKSTGAELRTVAPSVHSISVRQRHNFVQLPDGAYTMRTYDVRSGFFNISYMDYAVPLGMPVQKMFITRHRLEKKYPGKKLSEPLEPIIYYLDRGAPEPIRSALLEGASWWNEAFEAAGFKDAFRVEVLPEGIDPLDIRYNVIQWVHRSTRGWSYGASVVDPRTGEIIKGHVSLGSLRVRQDYMIAEGLLAPYGDPKAIPRDMQEMALARLRQLSAHEVGHTLGLAHNFAASASEGKSVMDYPHPKVMLDAEGNIDISDAYGVGAGSWDKVAIAYGYMEFATPKEEQWGLDSILRAAADRGFRYISDEDARPKGGAHPTAHLWDNGTDAVEELDRILDIRQVALQRFSPANIPFGRPLASLEDVLVPVYLMHRYQVEAAVKLIGGVEYTYAVRGEGQQVQERVKPEVQRNAVEMLLRTVDPAFLAIDRTLLNSIPPQPPGFERDRENHEMRSGPVFDPMAAAETAAGHVIELMLDPQRCERLVLQKSLDPHMPGLAEYLHSIKEHVLMRSFSDTYLQAIGERVAQVYVRAVIDLALDTGNSSTVRAVAFNLLEEIKSDMSQESVHAVQPSVAAYLVKMIESAEERFEDNTESRQLRIPDGSPIGHGLLQTDKLLLRCGGN